MSERHDSPFVSPRDLERRRARLLRMAFLLLLGVALAQVLWWMIDQTRLMNSVESELLNSAEAELSAARALLAAGMNPAQVAREFPRLTVTDLGVSADERREQVRDMRREHLNQYRWEGAFFLGVLLLGMVVLARAMKREVVLRHRQENFLAAVTHELKSPLASLRLASQTMERRELDPVQRRQLLDRNRMDLDRLEALISNVLESSRLDAKAAQLHRESIALAQSADHVVAAMAKIEHTGCDVVNEIPRDLRIDADRHGVLTVMRNLLDNAVEATRDQEEPVVRLSAQPDQQAVRFVVEDNGRGFVADQHERLFDKFYRPDEMESGRTGTGLGLYLVRRLVELEGGSVMAHSDGPGCGSRFEVTWPLERSTRAS